MSPAQLQAKVTQLRGVVDASARSLRRAEEWHAQEQTRASRENLREARSEHSLAANKLSDYERQLAGVGR